MAVHVRHAAEVYGKEGPTGRFVEVLEGEVHDYGGNVLFAGGADECAERASRLVPPVRLVPTKTRDAGEDAGEVAGEVAGADVTWQCVVR